MSDLLPWMAPYSGRVLTLVAFVIGCCIAWRGRRLVPFGHGCARCGYDLSGSPTPRCSECGHDRSASASRVGRRRWWLVICGLLLALALPGIIVRRRVSEFGWTYYTAIGPIYWLSPDRTLFRQSSGLYDICIVEDRREAMHALRTFHGMQRVEIRRGSTIVWQDSCRYMEAGWTDEKLQPLDDIDRDGTVDFLYTASDQGGTRLHVIRLGNQNVVDIGIEANNPGFNGDTVGVTDVDGDGIPEVIAMPSAGEQSADTRSGALPPPAQIVFHFMHRPLKSDQPDALRGPR